MWSEELTAVEQALDDLVAAVTDMKHPTARTLSRVALADHGIDIDAMLEWAAQVEDQVSVAAPEPTVMAGDMLIDAYRWDDSKAHICPEGHSLCSSVYRPPNRVRITSLDDPILCGNCRRVFKAMTT